MKKRLLSAALALAMVLTLLPFSAMPASAAAAEGATASYHAKFDNVITDNGSNTVPAWYAEERGPDNKVTGYEKITNGFIVGSKYYPTWNDVPNNTTLTSFTAIGNVTATLGSNVTSVNADLYGKDTGLAITGPTALTSVTVNDSKYASEVSAGLRQKNDKASLTAVGTLATNKAVSISLTNVSSDAAISLKTTNGATPAVALGHRVTLNNAKLGAITLGTLGDQANATSPKSSVAQNITLTNGSSCGAITVEGNGSRVQFTDSSTTAAAVTINGTGASFTMAGNSSAGDLTLFGVTQGNNGGKDSTAAPPSVTITAGTVGTITYKDNDAAKGNASVQLNSSSAYSGKVTMNKGTVAIQSGHASDVELKEGTLNVSGAGATTGDLTLGATKDTTLNVTGTGHTVGGITMTVPANVTLNIPESRTNTYGKAGTDLSTYTKHTIKGGTWVVTVPYSALDASLAWQFKKTTYTYYTQEQLGEALTAQVKAGTPNTNTITPTNSAGTDTKSLTFKSSAIEWGKITGLALNDVVYLPSSVNSTAVGRWTQVINDGTTNVPGNSFAAGYRYTMPDTDVVLDAGGGAASGNATKLINAAIAVTNASDVRKSVRASINGNVITLTGSLPVGTSAITLELTTDVQEADGSYATVEIPVVYHSVDKKLTFQNPGNASYDYGITVPDLDRLRLNDETVYTLSASMKDINAALELETDTADNIEVTVSASAYATQALRDGLKDALETDASFDWTDAPAIIQAINDVMGGTTDSQIKSWKDSADRTYYLKTHQSVPSTGVPSVFTTVHLVPYLAVTVNEHNSQGGTMKGTLTPMYRIEARSTEAGVDPIVVQTGRTLGALTGIMADDNHDGAVVKFVSLDYPAGQTFGGTGATLFAHQDGTYVYEYDTTDGMTITHAGKTGLGAFEINKTDGLVKVYDATISFDTNMTTIKVEGVTDDNLVATYSTLQAAVDDAKNGQYIEVDQNYTGSTSISVTGEARTIYVQAVGKNVVVANASGNLVESNKYGNLYSIKLNRDTAPIGGNITVSSATGGSASVSANPAQVGSKVTVTLSAQAGYSPSGVSVKDSSGKAVSVSGSGSSYSFTMPSGSVTVTPSFTKTQVTNPTVHVSSTTGGSAYTSAGNNQVAPGTTVTVTTTPGTNQRTMGVSVTGATAVRTGANTFQFTVPSGYNTVTVTPRFDANNGTLFQDVWSYEYYSNPVRWAVERGITNGTSTYTFGSENVCTREDMVTFLWRAAGSPTVSSSVRNPFWDVQAGSYYYNAVLWAVSKGITNGVSANQFGVGQYVTRGQAVTFLYRYEGSPAAGANSGFYDVNSREYYAKAVSWANAKGVTNGTSATTFGPNEYCKRAQIVTFLYRDITGNRA